MQHPANAEVATLPKSASSDIVTDVCGECTRSGAAAMRVWRCGAVAMVAAGGMMLAAACDDKPSVPQAILDQATTQADNKKPQRPTTQELVSGRRTSFLLSPLPLTMQVPESWKTEPLKGTPVTLLTGPTPASD